MMKKCIPFFAFALCYVGVVVAEPLYPLEVGMYWVYELEEDPGNPVTNKVISKKTILGNAWYELEEYGDTFWVRNSDQGQVEAFNLFNTDAQNVSEIEEVVIYRYPYRAGETYSIEEDVITIEGERTITVPAGTFQCIDYRIDMPPGPDYSLNCIAPGVGVVYNEFLMEGTMSISRLIKYGTK
jgi:hypothetical protein